MNNVLVLPIKNRSEVILLPKVFVKMYEKYKKIQNDIEKKKIEFLEGQAFQYFYDVQGAIAPKVDTSVNLPMFVLEYQAERKRVEIAKNNVAKVMTKIIEQGQVNYFYSKRIKQLKKIAKETNR